MSEGRGTIHELPLALAAAQRLLAQLTDEPVQVGPAFTRRVQLLRGSLRVMIQQLDTTEAKMALATGNAQEPAEAFAAEHARAKAISVWLTTVVAECRSQLCSIDDALARLEAAAQEQPR